MHPLSVATSGSGFPPLDSTLLHASLGVSTDPAPSLAPRWFAVRVLPQHEKTVARNLCRLGPETLLPLYRTRRAWSDRLKELQLPLFPCYVFARFPFRSRVPVLNIPGVLSIVSFARQPTPIPDAEIAAIRTMLSSGLPVHPWPYLKSGQRVLIRRGPLAGLEAIFLQTKGEWRVVVSVNLLQRSISAEIDRLWISR